MISVLDINDPAAGRFGNQLFKFATALAYSIKNSTAMVLPEWHFSKYLAIKPATIGINHLNSIDWTTVVDPQHYIELPRKGNINLQGYFQDLRYFNSLRHDIQTYLRFSPEHTLLFNNILAMHIPNWASKELCAIHVRRGDYLCYPQHHPVCGVGYYRMATQLLPKGIHYLVFSDDMDWCEQNIKFPDLEMTFIRDFGMYFDLWAISMCKHAILSNSTFGWWGAYLRNEEDWTIVPETWFGPALSHVDISHLRPKVWIQI